MYFRVVFDHPPVVRVACNLASPALFFGDLPEQPLGVVGLEVERGSERGFQLTPPVRLGVGGHGHDRTAIQLVRLQWTDEHRPQAPDGSSSTLALQGGRRPTRCGRRASGS